MSLNGLRVSLRLTLGFGLLLVLIAAMSALSLVYLNGMQHRLQEVVQQDYAAIGEINRMRDAVRFQAIALRDVVLQEDIAFKKKEIRQMKEARAAYNKASGALLALQVDAPGLALEQIRSLEDALAAQVAEVFEAALMDEHKKAQDLVRDVVRPKQNELLKVLDTAQATLESLAHEAARAADESASQATRLIIILAAVAVCVGIAIAWSISRSIVRPLDEALELANRIADGDLTRSLQVRGRDEFAILAESLNRMRGQLHETVSHLKRVAGQIGDSAGMLTSISGEGNAQSQAREDEMAQVSAAVQQMAVSIAEVASGAGTVAHSAQAALTVAQHGEQAMQRATLSGEEAMRRVSESNHALEGLRSEIDQVCQFTAVIREIAEQTNLLALNAAIEAARAGEQGRGFSVVADEVRKLSERTAGSTQSINETVQSISTKAREVVGAMDQVVRSVQSSLSITDESKAVFEQIADSARSVADKVNEIANATREQSSASSTTAQAVERISRMSEQGAETVREIDRAARGMQDTAQGLQAVVARFAV